MQAKLTWQGDEAIERITSTTWDRFKAMVVWFWVKIQAVLNRQNPSVYHKRTRDTVAGKKGSQYTTWDTPSLPGEPPRKRTGWLQAHTLYEFDEASSSARVGVGEAGKYGLYLELGTRHMQPRPWLLRVLDAVKDTLARFMMGEIQP